MPAHGKEAKKVKSWLAHADDGQEDPYDSDADEMAPSHSRGDAQARGLPDPNDDWEDFVEQARKRSLLSSVRIREETWAEITEVISGERIHEHRGVGG
jgi:hypothetical protein